VHGTHRYGHLRIAPFGNEGRRRRVKRGNLYPEQHQIGMRAALGSRRAAPSKHAGRWLERLSNDPRRGMIVRQGNLVYRIRPIDPSCIEFSTRELAGPEAWLTSAASGAGFPNFFAAYRGKVGGKPRHDGQYGPT